METVGLVPFLRARLDEDEWAARSVPGDLRQSWSDPGPWVIAGNGGGREAEVARVADSIEMPIAESLAHHIARHDPDRVLREVEAKRQIVARFEEAAADLQADYAAGRKNSEVSRLRAELFLVLAHHAEAHDDHPDYKETWRP